MSAGLPIENETELLAWALLRAANRTQARDTTVRLVVPRAPEVAGLSGFEEGCPGPWKHPRMPQSPLPIAGLLREGLMLLRSLNGSRGGAGCLGAHNDLGVF